MQPRDSIPCDNHGFFQLTGDFCGQLVVDKAGLWDSISLYSGFIALAGINLVQDA
jgi:hypothetical protein